MSVRVSMKFCVKQEGALEQMENFTADVPEDKGGAGYGGTVKTEKTENYSVSFLRGVGCIGVILIHFRFRGIWAASVPAWRNSQYLSFL